MCFRLTWCLTPQCIEILFFNKTTQELTQPDTLNSFLSKATSKFCHNQRFRRTLIQSNICGEYLQMRLDCQNHRPQNTDDLKHSLRRHWNAISRHFLQTLVSSMGHRCAVVLEAQGGHTRY
ncbi:hypothetical protein ElyMa_005565800 [Elysia marginata]|uniref:Uncharacterized protein n=1 Tax=Elysia marginata TaxID=1093978 RepID=A0AAV4F0I9_9GAST|nr:hypothetical protein ElyMa_005565800 [Elysia marginata]